jgi:hypothetical protein
LGEWVDRADFGGVHDSRRSWEIAPPWWWKRERREITSCLHVQKGCFSGKIGDKIRDSKTMRSFQKGSLQAAEDKVDY